MRRWPWQQREAVLLYLVVALAYYAAARLSLELSLVGRSVTPLWLPTGVAVVALIAGGYRIWPSISIAAFAVNVPISASPQVALGIAVGNTLAPLFVVWLLHSMAFRRDLARPHDALGLVAAALLGTTVSASIGTSMLVLSGAVRVGRFGPTWLVWWTGDAMGILLVAPFLWSLWPPHLFAHRRHLAEAILLYAVLIGTLALATRVSDPILFIAIPVLAWIAWRFQQRGAAPGGLIASVVVTLAVVHHVGQFAHMSLVNLMVTLQCFNAVVAFTTLFLAAAMAERVLVLERLSEIARVTQEAIIHSPAPLLGSVALAARYVSASDHAAVGGDLYESANTSFGVRLVIGDVRGKGLDAVRTAATALRSFRQAVYSAPDLATVVADVVQQTSPGLDAGEFITALFVEFTPLGRLRLANLGHPAPLILSDQVIRSLEPSMRSTPLGLDPTPSIDELQLETGDRILLFTDGLVEGRNRDGDFFPLHEIAADVLSASDLEEVLDDLLARYNQHAGGKVEDDIALLVAAWSSEPERKDDLDGLIESIGEQGARF